MQETDITGNKVKVNCMKENYGNNVLPLSKAENERFPGGGPIEIIFFYKKEIPILELKKSIVKTIECYNLFSSCLIMIDDNKFALQYRTDGFVPTILPPVDAAFDDIRLDDIRKKMVHIKTLPGEPLFAVTGIPIKDGILAGISCSHAVADGISLLLFLYAWMCITEGKKFPIPSPQRLFKGQPVRSDEIAKVFTPSLSALSREIQDRVKNNHMKTFAVREYFSDEYLNEIKNIAKSENKEHMISSNQIITSYLLKKYHRSVMPNADRIILRTPVNLRYIHPDIDPMYIGNANFNSVTEFTKDEIDNMPMHHLAYRIKESILGARNENYVKEIAYLSEYGVELRTDKIKNRPPSDMDRDVVSSNLTHLSDLESLFLGPETGNVLYIGMAIQTGFTILKEKNGRIFAEITSRYPFKN